MKNWYPEKWWDVKDRPIEGAVYLFKGHEIIVGSRPDAQGMDNSQFICIDHWLSVTDRYIPIPFNRSQAWFPWNEDFKLKPECLFPSLLTLKNWTDSPTPARIYIHCDAGNNVNLMGRERLSNPLEYAEYALRDIQIRQLSSYLRTIKDKESLADILKSFDKEL